MPARSDFLQSDTYSFFALDSLSPSWEDNTLYTSPDCSHQEGRKMTEHQDTEPTWTVFILWP